MTPVEHLSFVAFVALAAYVQNLTGFAFGLILLGLVGLSHVAPVADVTNAVSVVALVNAAMLGRRAFAHVDRQAVVPTLSASVPGVVCGVLLLNWLSDNVAVAMRLLLGATIVACAVLLLIHARARARRSAPWTFAVAGALSGVLGGLFSASGPPVVFHFYRQPMALQEIRSALVTIFAVNSGLRLAMMAATGRITLDSCWMTVEALPVVLLLGWHARRWPSRASVDAVRRIVSVLLAGLGLGIFVPALARALANFALR